MAEDDFDIGDSPSDPVTSELDVSQDTKPAPDNKPDADEPEINANDKAYRLSAEPDDESGYSPSEEDGKIVGELVDDSLMDSFKKFSKGKGISTGLFQRLVSFQLKAVQDGVTDDAEMLSRFKAFGKRERMSTNLFDAIVAFQVKSADQYRKGIAEVQRSSIRATGRPNPKAHEVYILSRSRAYNSKLDRGHAKAVEKMLKLCERSK